MATKHIVTATLVMAGLALTAVPSFAQRDHRDGGNHGDRRESGRAAQSARAAEQAPRGAESSRAVQSPRAVQQAPRVEQAPRAVESGRTAERRQEVVTSNRAFERQREVVDSNRTAERRREVIDSNRRFDRRPEVVDSNRRFERRPEVVDSNRRFDRRPEVVVRGGPRFGIIPRVIRPNIVNIVPYRPYAYRYRSRFSVDLHFGRPYGYGYPAYGYPSYGYVTPPPEYLSVVPGRLYGGVRIEDAPEDAEVFADGYYMGIVDDFDGIFQHMNLEAGPHRIEIQAPGYEPIVFDVRVEPDQTITYRANMQRLRP